MAPTTMKAELSALKPSELSKRAAADGVSQAAIDKAVDSDNPKEQLIDLIVHHAAATADAKKPRRKAKASRSKEGDLSLGQACCVILSTILTLVAICAAACMSSVRLPFSVAHIRHSCRPYTPHRLYYCIRGSPHGHLGRNCG